MSNMKDRRDEKGILVPTAIEKKWIERLKKLLSEHPPDVWLFNTGEMCIMRYPKGGDVYTWTGSVNDRNMIGSISSSIIVSDGGDW
jgi:hypothetical protein